MQPHSNIFFNLSVQLNAAGGPMGIIRAQGVDTVKFLQGQLTQDVALLGLSEARLAAWCSAKGRMLASFVVFKNAPDDLLLLCSPSVLPATLKRLQMFVMRAQCTLSDATAQFEVKGITQATQALQSDPAISRPTPWQLTRDADTITIDLPPGHLAGQAVPCALRVAPAAGTAGTAVANVDVDVDANALAAWHYLSVSSGIAHITAAISEAFVPQMLNYESVGGVNFKKGCYPGQEVVARSQFRGTLKRRAYIVSSAAPLQAGQEVFDSRDPDQPCGAVASAAQAPAQVAPSVITHNADQWLAIVSMQTSAAASPHLTLGGAVNGPTLTLQALPYALLEDI